MQLSSAVAAAVAAADAAAEREGIEPDAFDPLDDLELIHVAAYLLDSEFCKIRVERVPSDVDTQTAALVTPLILVCRQTQSLNEAIKVAEYFLDKVRFADLHIKGANPNAQTKTGRTPLIESIASKHTALAKLLLDRGANPFLRDSNDWTTLHQAAKWKNLVIMQDLIEKGMDIFAVDCRNRTPLLVAVKSNFLDGVKLLLKMAGSRAEKLANIAEEWGDTCVTVAAGEGFTKVLQVLMDNHANCNALRLHKRLDGGARLAHAIALAAQKGSHECVQMLLRYTNTEIVMHTDLDPVIAAVSGGSEKCLTLLMEAGYSVEVPNLSHNTEEPRNQQSRLFRRRFFTALYRAVQNHETLFVEKLLKAGAKMTYDSHCHSPFLYSLSKWCPLKILHFFLENDVDINLISDRTDCLIPDALRFALDISSRLHLLTLLRCGLDPSLKYWCTCKRQFPLNIFDYVERNLRRDWNIPKLMKLLVYFSPGIPSCCDKVAKMIDEKPEVPSLQHLCRLAIRKPLRTSQLLDGRFVENLRAPKTIKDYLTFKIIPYEILP